MYLKQTMHCENFTTICGGWQAFERAREAPILDVIQGLGGIELHRRGRSWVGLCPFHRERTPSFTVAPDKRMFHCFGCGAGGDGIAFIARLRGLSSLEAARLICRHFGLAVDKDPAESARLRREAKARRRRMAALNAAWREAWIIATAFYRAAARANEATNYSDVELMQIEIEAFDILNRLEVSDPQVRLTIIREVLG